MEYIFVSCSKIECIETRKRNKFRTHTSHDIQLLNRSSQFTRPLYIAVCQFVKDEKERHIFPVS